MMNRKIFKKGFVLLTCLIPFLPLLRCSPRQYPDSRFAACYPNHPYDTSSFHWTDPTDSVIRGLKSRYTGYSLLVANSAGLLISIADYEREKSRLNNKENALQRIGILEQREIIINRINLFRSQVASVAAELDCEGERADQLSVYLDKIDHKRTKNLTVASILSGAIGAVAAAALQGDQSRTAAIAGGIGSAVLGLISLSSNKKVSYNHPRNLLADIWLIPKRSKYYPGMVWNMLSHAQFSNSGEFSVAFNTRKGWQNYWGLKASDKGADKKIKLLMGQGGEYTADELKLRANMLNQLQAAVKLIDQDIQGLLSEIANEK